MSRYTDVHTYFKIPKHDILTEASKLNEMSDQTEFEYLVLKRFGKFIDEKKPTAADKKSLRTGVAAEVTKWQNMGGKLDNLNVLLSDALKSAKLSRFVYG